MSTISVRRSHNLSHERAKQAAENVAGELKDKYGMRSRWKDDTLHFERSGASGTLKLAPKEVQIDVQLGFLLTAFRDTIAREIELNLDEHLAAKTDPPKRRRK